MLLHTVLRTKIIPPPRGSRILPRPRVSESLKQAYDYRLTILQAGAGYGKSTALAELSAEMKPIVWYQIGDEDNDPLVFLLHICYAIKEVLPEINDLPTAFLESWSGGQGPLPWREILDQIINALSNGHTTPTLLILDDAHHVTDTGDVPHMLDRLIGLAPANFHVLLSGRPTITLPNLARWRAKGDVLFIDQAALTFTVEEIAELFINHYNVELTTEDADSLLSYTEGWAIALQLIWQNLRAQPVPSLDFPSHWQAGSLDALFDLLARDVFAGQSADVREFLLITSTLRDLTPEVCDELRRAVGNPVGDSSSMLAYLKRQDLFIVETAEGMMRFHHVFHNFLRQQSTSEQRQKWNRIAADYFIMHNNSEAVIYHLLEAQAWDALADMLDQYSGNLLSVGRLDTLAIYIDSLPPEILHRHPMLIFTLGELARLHSRFDESLGWYTQAETLWRNRGQQEGIARALRGQARVYLDTLDPPKAEELLEKAILLSDGFEDREAQIRLYELLSENKLNTGQVDEAERLLQRAEALRTEGPSNEQIWFRVLVRTGRLTEARRVLEERAETEKHDPVNTPRAHRETVLLLSLVYSFMGLGEHAYQVAREGTRRGDELKSPFMTAVGHLRQGHAFMLHRNMERRESYNQGRTQFEKSVEISRMLSVPRLLIEADWGLCRVSGYQGDLVAAQKYAQEAIEFADQYGDEWVASLTRVTMGASLSLASRYEAAEEWLNRALNGFQECSDPFGSTAVRLWLSFGYLKQKQTARLERTLPEVLSACRTGDFGFLFTRPSLLGASDERIFVPLLIMARDLDWESVYASQLLEEMDLARIGFHPGYQLRVETLGGFQVWRGDEAIPSNGWRRGKSRQLFQLLLTYRHAPLDRDQICEHLWPDADLQTAQRNFKIALNTLFQVLEPERDAGTESAYILREGTTYGLRPHADLWLDADEFTKAVKVAKGKPELLQRAVDLFAGEYLPDAIYETWAAEERERLSAVFLETADALVDVLIKQEQYTKAIDICQRILAQDNCWERAYRHLMLAYDGLNDRGQVGRTYQRCVQTLRDELDVSPAPETQKLYDGLTNN